jgi:hypothetical protein
MVGSFFQTRKDAVRVGGLVSIEELTARRDARGPVTSGSVKKVLPPLRASSLTVQKTPTLSFSRRSLRLSRSRDSAPLSPSLHSPPPFESAHNRLPADARKQSPVSDGAAPSWQQDAPGLTRRRSKTADGSTDPRPRAPSSHDSSRESKSSYSSATTRPRTSSGTESSTSQAKTDSLKASYSLVPSINTMVPRVPQQKSPMSGASPASFTRFHLPGAPHSYPNSPRNSTPGTPLPAIRSSILDEVEGTLTATITELQELQGVWHHDSPPVTPEQAFASAPALLGAERSRPSTSRASSRDRGSVQPVDYFDQRQMEPSGVQSSPLKTVASADGDPQMLALQAAYEEQRKLVRTLTMENDGIKRRLVFVGARLNEFETEKSALARAAKDARDNLQVTLLKLREAKDSESSAQQEYQSARNAMSIMERRYDDEKKRHGLTREELDETTQRLNAKLEEVNTHKVDLLEKELESRRDLISTKKKLKKAVDELNSIKRKEQSAKAKAESSSQKLRESQRRNEMLQDELNKLSPQSDLPSRIAEMAFRLEDMQAQLEAKDEAVASLTAQTEQATALTASLEDQNRELSERLDQARNSVGGSEATDDGARERLEAALVERDKYAALLHAEIRRTAVDDHGRSHPSKPFLKKKLELDDAVRLVRERARAYLGGEGATAEGEEAEGEEANEAESVERLRAKVADLEKEIEYYLNDIVLYKLDVKGYRKDLRKAEQRLRDMSEVQRQDEAGRTDGTVQ